MLSGPTRKAHQEDILILKDGFSRILPGPDLGFCLSFSSWFKHETPCSCAGICSSYDLEVGGCSQVACEWVEGEEECCAEGAPRAPHGEPGSLKGKYGFCTALLMERLASV